MTLNYWDRIAASDTGLEYGRSEPGSFGSKYAEPTTVDMIDLAAINDDWQIGNIFDKEDDASKSGSAEQKSARNQTVPESGFAKNIKFINQYINPASVSLRNDFLLATKQNLLNIGGRLRYAYLTDEEALQRGINIEVLQNLRKIKDKAEQIYHSVGGFRNNLRKAILTGSGNAREHYVPIFDFWFLNDTYADQQEYNILYRANPVHDFREDATGSYGVSAKKVVDAIAEALKQLNGLFPMDDDAEISFQSETDNAAQTPMSEEENNTNEPAAGNVTELRGILADEDKSLIERTTEWIGNNPVKSLLVAGALLGSGILVKRFLEAGETGGSQENRKRTLGTNRKRKQRNVKKDKIAFAEMV